MPESAAPSPTPRSPARGLDLAALAAIGLEGSAAPPPPEVPGYEIESLLGTGGLGHVWKAMRLADGATVALKIPHAADPAFAGRLHGEAESLRALNHPHILRCLSHGTLPDGHPWLALEYVDGAPLSVLIPPGGFAWEEALTHFRRIADAVIHAHEKGVLHRDLKPANVLIGHDGSLKVADFGLARPVAERVVSFSLTLSGHVAGTAEYLAPECYARDHRPAAAADIYALGVILYELLAGSPPRGAWTPVSQQKQVDIRVDDVLHRALEPDPGKRFLTAHAMLAELERIARTPPRYSGTPRLTRPIRFIDAMWTILGIFLFLGTLGLVVRIEKYGIALPVDLIGTGTIRIGTYQGILILLVVAVPFGLWQLFRLWRFRAVPLREGLPSPFGLRMGASTTAALAVLLAQVLFLIAPGVLGALAWRETCTSWLKEGVPPWKQGLVVTEGYQGKVAHDPWQWPEKGKEYSLREHAGWITDPFRKQIDHTNFIPGLIPRIIAGCAIFYAATIVLTILSAFARWWRFRKWGRAVVLIALLCFAAREVQAVMGRYDPNAAWAATDHEHAAYQFSRQIEKLDPVYDHLFPADGPPGWESPPTDLLDCYATEVVFNESLTLTGPALAQHLADYAAQSRAENRRSFKLHRVKENGFDSNWGAFRCLTRYEAGTDPPGGPSTGGLTILALYGSVSDEGVSVTAQIIDHRTLYSAVPRPLSSADANAWAEAFFAALSNPPPASQPDPLDALFFSEQLHFQIDVLPVKPMSRESFLAPLRASRGNSTHLVLTHPPDAAEELPGARRRIVIQAADLATGDTSTWTADLIHHDGRWQCVKLTF